MKVTLPSRRGWIFTAAVSVVALGLPLVFQTEHPHESWWNHIPGFFAEPLFNLFQPSGGRSAISEWSMDVGFVFE